MGAQFPHADNENSIGIFVGRTYQKVRFLTLRFILGLNCTSFCSKSVPSYSKHR